MKVFLPITLLLLAMNIQAKPKYELTLISDYLFRGVTMTDNGPALQWGAEIRDRNAYGKAWFSNIELSDQAEGLPIEMDIHLGYHHQFSGFNLDTEIITYNTFADEGKEETEFKFGTRLSKVSRFDVYRGLKLKTWYPQWSFKKYIERRVYLSGRVGYWMFDDASDDALHSRLFLGMDFPEFNGFTLYLGGDFISDEQPGNDNDTDDEHLVFVFGFTKQF